MLQERSSHVISYLPEVGETFQLNTHVYSLAGAPTPVMKIDVWQSGSQTFNSESQTTCLEGVPDTGATKSVISLDTVIKSGFNYNRDLTIDIRTCSEELLECEGVIVLSLSYQGQKLSIECLVSSSLTNLFLISLKDLIALGVVSADFPQVQKGSHVRRVAAVADDDHVQGPFRALLSEFHDVFEHRNDGALKTIKGPKMHIQLKNVEGMRPIKCLTAKRVPVHLEEEAKKEIQSLVKQGVIIKMDEATEWISPSFFIVKPSGSLRLVTNFRRLNQYVERPVHPFPSASDISGRIPFGSKYFVKFDALKGYYQIPLDKKSVALTTFLVPNLGRYAMLRAPMGLNSSGDEFCQRVDAALEGIDGFLKIVDDIIIFGPDMSVVLDRVRKVLTRCREKNITLSIDKAEIGSSVRFAGFVVSARGISPDPDKLKALREFPVPSNLTTLRSFLGLANYVGSFIPNLSQVTSTLRGLLKKNVSWQWFEEHQKCFEETIKTLLNYATLQHYNPNQMCELLTDASNLNGIGFALTQLDENNHRRIIQCGSRSLSPAERNYAVVELELLAIVWAIKKCRVYLANRRFKVVTDHRPLIGLVAKDSLDYLDNRRLVSFMDKISGYDFEIEWVPGKNHCLADSLSRNPVDLPDEVAGAAIKMISAVTTRSQAFDTRIMELSETAVMDPVYQKIVSIFEDHKHPRSLANDHPAKALQGIWDYLSLENDLLWYNNRIIVPRANRSKILQLLHVGHCGYHKTMELARMYYYWPGMNNEIRHVIEGCDECQKYRASQPIAEPITSTASEPLEALSLDLFHLGQHEYLIIVDRFSGFPWVFQLRQLSTEAILKCCRQVFRTFGAPQRCRTDGGPQFRTPFTSFCQEWGIRHELSSPYNPRSNGHAEAAVKSMKQLLAKYNSKWEDFEMALLEWRNTPRQNQKSPAELMFHRRQKTLLPGSGIGPGGDQGAASPSTATDPVQSNRQTAESRGRHQYDTLEPGTLVRVQDVHTRLWTQKGKIVSCRDTGRSFYIDLYEDGGEPVEKSVLRNRRFIKKL